MWNFARKCVQKRALDFHFHPWNISFVRKFEKEDEKKGLRLSRKPLLLLRILVAGERNAPKQTVLILPYSFELIRETVAGMKVAGEGAQASRH
jgi:hypothetical protein